MLLCCICYAGALRLHSKTNELPAEQIQNMMLGKNDDTTLSAWARLQHDFINYETLQEKKMRLLFVTYVANTQLDIQVFKDNFEKFRSSNRAGDTINFALFHYDSNNSLWNMNEWYTDQNGPIVMKHVGAGCPAENWAMIEPQMALQYDYIWMADSDVSLSTFSWDVASTVIKRLKPIAAQPALLPGSEHARASPCCTSLNFEFDNIDDVSDFQLAREVYRSEVQTPIVSSSLWPAMHARMTGGHDLRTAWNIDTFWDVFALEAKNECNGTGILVLNGAPVQHLDTQTLSNTDNTELVKSFPGKSNNSHWLRSISKVASPRCRGDPGPGAIIMGNQPLSPEDRHLYSRALSQHCGVKHSMHSIPHNSIGQFITSRVPLHEILETLQAAQKKKNGVRTWSVKAISDLTNPVSGLRLLRDIADDQVLVLRTAGKVSSCINDELVPQYFYQLSKANVRFSILHYGTQDDWKTDSWNQNLYKSVQKSSSHEFFLPGMLAPWKVQISREIRSFSIPNPNVTGMSMERREGIVEFNVPICYVNWTLTAEAFPLNNVSSASVHYIHDQNVVLWHRYCMQDISPPVNEDDVKFWFVEDDAIFSGNVAHFIQAHSALKDDLVTTGLRIAGPHWWKVKAGFWKTGEPYVKKFGKTSKAVRNIEALPSLRDGNCRDGSFDEHGFLFFQDHVMRLSTQLLNTLYEYLERGIIGPSESWLATLCASVTSCSIYDFEPQHLNSIIGHNTMNTWVSDSYCWNAAPTEETYCNNKDKWFHSYKCKKGHHDHLPKCDP